MFERKKNLIDVFKKQLNRNVCCVLKIKQNCHETVSFNITKETYTYIQTLFHRVLVGRIVRN